MKRKDLVAFLVALALLAMLSEPVLASDRDRYTNWSRYYNGVCFRYITSYLGADVWSAYPDAVQFYNSRNDTAKITYWTTNGGPRVLFLEGGQYSERTALTKDESITEINVTASEEKTGWNLQGTWRGTGYQSNNSSWTIELVVSGNSYSIRYPSLTCGGYWTLESMGSDSATFTEHITVARNRCIDNGTVTLRRSGTNTVEYNWVGGSPRQSASATLTR